MSISISPLAKRLLIVALGIASSMQFANATTTTFQPGVTPDVSYDIDAVYIREGQSNQNGDTDLEVLVGWSGGPFRGLLEFDLSEIPSTDLVDSVSLFLKTRDNAGGSGTGIQYHLYEYGYDIDEAAATWAAPAVSDADPTDGGTLGTLLASVTFDSSNQGEEVTFLDSAAFRTAIENALAGDGFVRFLIKENNESGTAFARFADENWPDTSFRPKLTVEHSTAVAEPVIVSLSPEDDSTGVYVGTSLVALFDEDIALSGSGSVTIVEDPNGTPSSTVINLPAPSQVTVSGSELTIVPGSNLADGTEYAIQISSDAIVDLSTDNGGGPYPFAGISDTTTWSFTTAVLDSSGPVLSTKDPVDNAVDVVPNATLVATFDEDLILGSGNLYIYDVLGASVLQTIAVTDASQVSLSGATLTITPLTQLDPAKELAVQFDAGIVKNFSDVGNLALSDTTTWSFTTASDTTFTFGGSTSNSDTWNVPGNWDIAVPTGALNVFLPAGAYATVWDDATPTYTGDLSIGLGATLQVGWTTNRPNSYNALGTPGDTTITMASGSFIKGRTNATFDVPAIVLTGDATFRLGESTQTPASPSFPHGVTGAHTFTIESNASGPTVTLNAANTFDGLVLNSIGTRGGNHGTVKATVAGSLGGGDITLSTSDDNQTMKLELDIAGATTVANTLNINGGGPSGDGTEIVQMDADNTIGFLNINSFPRPSGTYGRIGLGGVDNEVEWISGNSILTVDGAPADASGPVGTIVSAVDDTLDVLVSEIYIIDFDEPIVPGAGNILIKNLTDATTTTIAASDSLQAKIVDETRLIIDPIVNLLAGKDYAIQIEGTAFEDLFGNAYAGILDDTTLNFTTVGSKIVFTENFEPAPNGPNTDVDGYSQGSYPALWDRHAGPFGATRHGLVDKLFDNDGASTPVASGYWDDDGDTSNTQAYKFNYTSSPGITTKVGEIGTLTLGTTYTIEFDVQEDDSEGGIGLGYDVRLYAFDEGGNRNNASSAFGGDVLGSESSEVADDGDFHTITLPITPSPASFAGSVTKDVGLMFKDRWNGNGGFEAGIHDNVVVTASGESIAPTVDSIDDDVAGGPVAPGATVVFTVTFDDWMDASTIGTGDFEDGGTSGSSIVSVSATADPAVYEVTVDAGATGGDLILQIKSGAVLNDAAHNPLDTGAAIPDATTITVEDTTAPAWEATYPQVTGVTDTGATARAAINEAGTAYYVVVADGAGAPSSAQVVAGNDSGDAAAIASGSIALPTATVEGTDAISGLTASTAYDVYFVAQDDEGSPNLQATPVKVDITTTAGGGTTYDSWSGSLPADGDANGDGVENAVAYALGAADVSEDATDLLPTSAYDDSGSPTYLVFTYNRSDEAEADGTTLISVEYGSDLSGWTTAVHDPGGTGVLITVTDSSPTDAVEVKIPATLAVGDKLFARLSVVVTP